MCKCWELETNIFSGPNALSINMCDISALTAKILTAQN